MQAKLLLPSSSLHSTELHKLKGVVRCKKKSNMSFHSISNFAYILMMLMWAFIPTTLYDTSNIAEPSAYQYLSFAVLKVKKQV